MEEEKNSFFVVKKGDVIAIYKSLTDLAEAGISGNDPSLSVYKGYGLSKQAEVYLGTCGIKNAAYSISVSDVNDNTFGKLVPCPPQQPTSFRGNTSNRDPSPNRCQQILGKDQVGSTSPYTFPRLYHMNVKDETQTMSSNLDLVGSTPPYTFPRLYHMNVKDETQTMSSNLGLVGSTPPYTFPRLYHMNVKDETQTMSSNLPHYIIEFDGASKGNPGPAGAGAVFRAADGRVVGRLREGVGIATNNVAEYRAAILGMKYALRKGFKHVRVQGDSNLVVMQVQGKWKIKSQNLLELNKEAKVLKDKFLSFQIKHVDRQFNSEADALANQAVNLMNGQVQEEWI